VVVALALAGGFAYATIPDLHGIVHTCFSQAVGTWRPINYPTQQCKRGEQLMDLYTVAGANAALSSVTVNNTSANPVPVREQNLDANGNIKVHEQGTANVNVTNTNLSVAQPAPITNGGGQADIPAGSSPHNLGNTVTASALSLCLPNEVFSLTLYRQGNEVAVFLGPGPGFLVELANLGEDFFTNSIMNVPLSRPLTFDSAKCSSGGNLSDHCFIGWVGNSP
jgi:hypothetical protein